MIFICTQRQDLKKWKLRNKIQTILLSFGIEQEDIKIWAKTGLVVDIKGTAAEINDGECNMIAYRADMDALPMIEETQLEYKSVNGNAHMCGHDGHMATLVATAQFWALHREKIPKNKTIRLLFQPAEEAEGGAVVMIEEGCLEGVDEVYGYHNAPFGYEGSISIKPGPIMAGGAWVHIIIEGQGGHGSEPAKSIDPITAACQVHNALHTIKSRKLLNTDVLAFTICKFTSGTTDNVIPRTATMSGTFRFFDDNVRDLATEKIKQITQSVSEAFDCKSTVDVFGEYPPVINHDKQAELVSKIAKECLGKENVNEKQHLPWFAGEDFWYFLHKKPGAFILLNNIKFGEEPLSLHSPFMDFNDNIIATGAYLNIKISEDRLGISLL